MGLFGGSQKPSSVALFDISSSTVAGAYARVQPGRPAALMYSVRIPIPESSGPLPSALLMRTLDEVALDLRKNGAPILHRRTGSGSVDAVYVNVGGRWQDSEIRIETITDEKSFVFGEADLAKARKRNELKKGEFRSEEAVVATLLNGYETKEPVGKRAKRAEIIMLLASMPEETAKQLRRTLGGFATNHEVHFTGFPSLVLESFPAAFTVEKDYIALRVSGETTELVFVERGYPVSVATIQYGVNEFVRAARGSGFSGPLGSTVPGQGGKELTPQMKTAQEKWTGEVAEALKAFAATRALPRAIFLVTDHEVRDFIRTMLDVPALHTLWLSDEPLAITPLQSSQFGSLVGHEPEVVDDAPLDMLAVLAGNRHKK